MEIIYILAFPFLAMLILVAFQAGQASKEWPSEEEMIRRIVESRRSKRITEEIEADVQNELNRQAAR